MEIEKNFDINTELSADQRKELCRVILKHKHIFVTNLSEIKTLKFEPYKIVLKPNAVPVSFPLIIFHMMLINGFWKHCHNLKAMA